MMVRGSMEWSSRQIRLELSQYDLAKRKQEADVELTPDQRKILGLSRRS